MDYKKDGISVANEIQKLIWTEFSNKITDLEVLKLVPNFVLKQQKAINFQTMSLF